MKIALTLIEHGAKLDLVDLLGTSRNTKPETDRNNLGREPLLYAVANERVALVHLFLLKNAPLDSRDVGGPFSHFNRPQSQY